MRILMPSRGRAGACSTLKLIPSACIVCSEKESEAYSKAYPKNEIIVEPDWVNNIVKCRAFLLDTFRSEDIFMVDDDVMQIRRAWPVDASNAACAITSPDHILEVLENTQFIAEQTGCYLWGYANNVNPVAFSGLELVELTGYLNNSYMGFRKGHNLKYNKRMTEGEDHYICLMNKHLNRKHVRDSRYSFRTDMNFSKAGGCQLYRNTSEMLKNTNYLQRMFGYDIVSQKENTQIKQNTNLGERTIHFPF